VEAALDKTLANLGTSYLDLYLMHWPVAFRGGDDWFPTDNNGVFDLDTEVEVASTWQAMVKLLATGKVKSVGVSSMSCFLLFFVSALTSPRLQHQALRDLALSDRCHSGGESDRSTSVSAAA
jgi:aryl-alcohol dehydrogenase-like predicted oxidoreductase